MHILITGAAGMLGRKLTQKLVQLGRLDGQAVAELTLIDVVAPEVPAGFAGKTVARAADIASQAEVGGLMPTSACEAIDNARRSFPANPAGTLGATWIGSWSEQPLARQNRPN